MRLLNLDGYHKQVIEVHIGQNKWDENLNSSKEATQAAKAIA